MKELIFYEGMEQLTKYFNKDLSSYQRDLYFQETKDYVSDKSFNFAIKTIIKDKKPMPGNFPTISDLQSFGERPKPKYKPNENDEEYYSRVSVTDLWKATDILNKQGHDAFISFATINHFNADDIDRVECKVKYAFKGGDVKGLIDKIGIKINPNQRRP